MKNFRQPYFSSSVGEFWRRWHISLSTWFRDYLYVPLGGNQTSRWRQKLNLLIVFLVSGLWHGANWTYVVWGGLHGFYLVVERSLRPTGAAGKAKTGLAHAAGLCLTFALVTYAWIYFRAASLHDAVYISSHLLQGWKTVLTSGGLFTRLGLQDVPLSIIDWGGLTASVLILVAVDIMLARRQLQRILQWHGWQRWILYQGFILWILLFGDFGSQSFIYFQF